MSDLDPRVTVDRCRAAARQLLRRFRSADPAHAREAAARFVTLRSFAGLTVDALLADPDRVRLKHRLAVVAVQHGFASWLALKAAIEAASAAGALSMYEPRLATFLNRWFADYVEARTSLEREGGFLLPFRNQFFVTEGEAIRELGLDPDDPDWERIGRDWVRPADAEAHARLAARRRAVMRA